MPPPKALLRYLIENPPAALATAEGDRALLAKGDASVRERALELLASRRSDATDRDWFIFEGATSVDAYLETEDMIVVIEGKRTEAGPTTRTTWMETRHQMLRNIDAAWDLRKGRSVVGFFIVEGHSGEDVSDEWAKFARDTVSATAIDASLPHRDLSERASIAGAFLGVTSWQRVRSALEIQGRLPNEVTIAFD